MRINTVSLLTQYNIGGQYSMQNKSNNPSIPNFKALAVSKAANSKSLFFNQFLESKKGILDFLKEKTMSADAVFKLLCHATSDEKTADNVVKELSKNPRKSEGIKNFLVEKLGGDKKGTKLFWTWFHDEKDGYRQAYAGYYIKNVWDKAKSLVDLVKQSPNVAPWAFVGKAKEMGAETVLGNVPEAFGNIKSYRKLIEQLKASEFHKAFLDVKDLGTKSQSSDTMMEATKANQKLQEKTKPFMVNVDGNEFEAKPIVQSFSAKLIYFLTSQKDKSQKYVLKFDPYELKEQTDKAMKFGENQALRADMPYLDAMVDFYLKENKSPNAPDIKLYDYETKSVLYGMTKGDEPIVPEKYTDNLYTFTQYNKIADLRKLGIELSDVHPGNFKVDKDGNYVLIDSGHVKYSNTFRPSVIGRHIIMGNLCGRELCK